ncbi:MAG: leucine-rich repeat protein [Lachnospiraceae bacterium]|nr:leucine-rich repeat protein [Lachnospiraceae bacterium]
MKARKKHSLFLTIIAMSLSAVLLGGYNMDAFAAPSEQPSEGFITGVVPESAEYTYSRYKHVETLDSSPTGSKSGLESAYDGRAYQTSVKSQGGYGLCWTFGTYGTLESYLKKNQIGIEDLSEIHMAYCTSNENGNDEEGEERYIERGGNRGYAAAYLMRGTGLNGVVLEENEPYPDTELYPSAPKRTLQSLREAPKQYTVRNILYMTGQDKPTSSEIEAIKNAVKLYGGVGASMYWPGSATATANNGADSYYNADTASFYFNDTQTFNNGRAYVPSTNHMVEIVGWDDDYAVSNFNEPNRPSAPGAWLVKNSWGKTWGNKGYFWISYEDHNFPITTFCFDGVDEFDPAKTVYEYDYKDAYSSVGTSSTTNVFAKVFETVHPSETVETVKVMIADAGCIAQVAVVPGFSGAGDFADVSFSDGVTIEYPGWYTLDLPEPCVLETPNTSFAVIVKLSSTRNDPPYVSFVENSAPSGTSWIGSSSASTLSETAYNLMIKAVTSMNDETVADVVNEKLVWDKIRGENAATQSGESYEVRTDLNLLTSMYGIPITWTSTAEGFVDTTGRVIRGTANETLTLTAHFMCGTDERTKDFEVTVIGIPAEDTQTVQDISDNLWELIKKSNSAPSAVTGNLDLNTSYNGYTGGSVSWKSSDTSIIMTDGFVIRPSIASYQNGNVTLTATITCGEATAEKQLELFVPYIDETTISYEDRLFAANTWMQATKNGETNWWRVVKGDNTSTGEIRYDLDIPSEMIYGVTVESVSFQKLDNNNQLTDEIWNCFDADGKITRPAYGHDRSKGSIKLALSYPNSNMVLNATFYPLTVPAYEGTLSLGNPVLNQGAKLLSGSINATLTTELTKVGDPGTVSYQWYEDTDDVPGDGTKIARATKNTYKLPVTMSEGRHYFYCVASAKDAKLAISDAISVNITEPVAVTGITIDPETQTLARGETVNLHVAVAPDNATDQSYTWTIVNADGTEGEIISLPDENGNITAEHAGEATITATTIDGGFQASCVITVPKTELTNNSVIVGNINGSYPYQGSAITPNPTVCLSDGSSLLQDIDYELSYSNNVNAGNASVTITGIGDYKGQITVPFKILPIAFDDIGEDLVISLDPLKYEYTGEAITPKPNCKWNTLVLDEDTDYVLSYENNLNVNDPANNNKKPGVLIGGTGNYTGSICMPFDIIPADIDDVNVSGIDTEYEFCQSDIKPSPVVKKGDKTLILDQDYTLTYSNNHDAGTANITIQGIGNYKNTKNVTFAIIPKNISEDIGITCADQGFTGSEIEPETVVKNNGVLLTSGLDYTVTYENNVNAGQATVKIKGINNYNSETSALFTIRPADIETSVVTFDESYEYTGSEIKALPKVVYNGGYELEKDTDFTVSYSNNIGVSDTVSGNAIAEITGKGNFTGTRTTLFTIVPANIANDKRFRISGIDESYPYTGAQIKPELKVYDTALGEDESLLVKDTDYTIFYSENCLNVGQSFVIITGIGRYSGSVTYNYDIVPVNLSDTTVSDPAGEFVYCAGYISPELTITYKGKNLLKNTDYSVSYSDNYNAGTAKIMIEGYGNFTGSVTKQFTIKPAEMKDAEVIGLPESYVYTGESFEPVVTIVFMGDVLVEDGDYSISYQNNMTAGTASLKISGKKNFSGDKTVTFTIEPADITRVEAYEIDTEYEFTQGPITPEPTVMDGGFMLQKGTDYSIDYADNTNVGTAIITISGLGNYTGTKVIQFTITQANINRTILTVSEDSVVYADAPATLDMTVDDNGTILQENVDYSVEYHNNDEVGKASCEISGINNYTGLRIFYFTIRSADAPAPTGKSLQNATLRIEDAEYTYTGKEITPKPVIQYGYDILTENTDYIIHYSDNKNAGTCSLIAEGIGGYYGEIGFSFDINAALISNSSVTISGIEDTYTYNGLALTPKPVISFDGMLLVEGTDYSLTYKNNSAVGTGSLTISGIGNFTGERTISLKINKQEEPPVSDDDNPSGSTDPVEQTNPPQNQDTAQQQNQPQPPVTPSATEDDDNDNDDDESDDDDDDEDWTFEEGDQTEDEDSSGIYEVSSTKNGAETVVYTGVTESDKNKTTITIPAKVELPDGKTYQVTEIKAKAFKGNKKLKKIVIGSNIIVIGSNAFNGCANLTTVTIKGSALNTIKAGAFSGCKKMKSITIGKNVRKIEKNAFKNCSGITLIKFKVTNLKKLTIKKGAFNGINSKCKIKVPGKYLGAYKKVFKKANLPAKVKVTK